ncbi:hypothetical protein TNCV_4412371 [Trichonephila clavipes]|nr:hypothetical protein TNCV_4412371 [Trichonephila clavipes]
MWCGIPSLPTMIYPTTLGPSNMLLPPSLNPVEGVLLEGITRIVKHPPSKRQEHMMRSHWSAPIFYFALFLDIKGCADDQITLLNQTLGRVRNEGRV